MGPSRAAGGLLVAVLVGTFPQEPLDETLVLGQLGSTQRLTRPRSRRRLLATDVSAHPSMTLPDRRDRPAPARGGGSCTPTRNRRPRGSPPGANTPSPARHRHRRRFAVRQPVPHPNIAKQFLHNRTMPGAKRAGSSKLVSTAPGSDPRVGGFCFVRWLGCLMAWRLVLAHRRRGVRGRRHKTTVRNGRLNDPARIGAAAQHNQGSGRSRSGCGGGRPARPTLVATLRRERPAMVIGIFVSMSGSNEAGTASERSTPTRPRRACSR